MKEKAVYFQIKQACTVHTFGCRAPGGTHYNLHYISHILYIGDTYSRPNYTIYNIYIYRGYIGATIHFRLYNITHKLYLNSFLHYIMELNQKKLKVKYRLCFLP